MKPIQKHYEAQAASIIRHLEKRGMKGYYCPDRTSARDMALSLLEDSSSVSWGGSMTLEECGIPDALRQTGLTVIDRGSAETFEERQRLTREAFCVDSYFMSANAVTLDGQLVNIDGNGNRVAALCFGPRRVFLVVGMNKVAADVQEAISRVHVAAAPPNAQRLNLDTPCCHTGVCADCLSKDCICAQTVVTRFSRTPGRICVILVGETLGY